MFLAGVICFFAYNWAALGVMFKFALPLSGLLLCAFGAYYKGLASGAGRVLSFAAGLFAGVFFAVYGQVYQTGAFVYEFCLAWALCLLPLAALACNRWLWLLWAAVCNAYLISRFGTAGSANPLFWSVFVFNAFCFAASELTYCKTRRGGWFSLFFLIPALFALFARGITGWGHWFWLCAGLILLFAFYGYIKKRGAAQLGLCALALDCLLAERIVSQLRAGGFFVTVVSILIVFVLSAWGVYALTRKEAAHE